MTIRDSDRSSDFEYVGGGDPQKAVRGLLKEHGKFLRVVRHGELWEVPATGGTVHTIPRKNTKDGQRTWKNCLADVRRSLRNHRMTEEQLDQEVGRVLGAPAVILPSDHVTAAVDNARTITGEDLLVDLAEKVTTAATPAIDDDADADGDDDVRAVDEDHVKQSRPHPYVRSIQRSEGGHYLCATCGRTKKWSAHATEPAALSVHDGTSVVLPCPHCAGSGSLTVPLADLREFLLKRGS